MANYILSTASEQLLDRMLEHRLNTIPARRLVNALARAGRLGYLPTDVIEESAGERVYPCSASLPPGSSAATGISSSPSFSPPIPAPSAAVSSPHLARGLAPFPVLHSSAPQVSHDAAFRQSPLDPAVNQTFRDLALNQQQQQQQQTQQTLAGPKDKGGRGKKLKERAEFVANKTPCHMCGRGFPDFDAYSYVSLDCFIFFLRSNADLITL